MKEVVDVDDDEEPSETNKATASKERAFLQSLDVEEVEQRKKLNKRKWQPNFPPSQ